jgi:phosphatidylinositol alpha-1,6-mannosyltransferase
MRLCILSTEFPPGPGGIGTHAYELARWLTTAGWEVSVVAPQNYASRSEIEAFNQAQPFPVSHLRSLPGGTPVRTVDRWRSALRWIRTWKPEMLLGSGSRAVWLTALIARRESLPWVAVGHGTEFGTTGWLERKMTYDSFRAASGVVCVSSYTRDCMVRRGIVTHSVRVIPNGADPQRFAPLPPEQVHAFRADRGWNDCRVLLTVGNVTPRKGQEVVIRALPQVLSRLPNVHYVMAGLPTQKVELQRLAENLGVARNVHFSGRVESKILPLLVNGCDVFVMTSRHTSGGDFEGYGIAVIEAALCGKPAVVSAGSGLAEAVVPDRTGLVVPQNDTEATAAAILRMLTDNGLRERMGEAARMRAIQEQTWEQRVSEYADFLRTAGRAQACTVA